MGVNSRAETIKGENSLKTRSKRILQFCAIMSVALEYGMYVEDDLREIFEASLPKMDRASKRKEMKAYEEGWKRLMGLLKRYGKINESVNPEWFDSVVDRLTDVIENEIEVEVV
jgi:hypothetical protein